MKKYQVIVQDEWNNLYHLGFYKELKDATPDINDWLYSYNTKIEEDLCEYPSTFSSCFDREIEVDDGEYVIYIRGFIFDD